MDYNGSSNLGLRGIPSETSTQQLADLFNRHLHLSNGFTEGSDPTQKETVPMEPSKEEHTPIQYSISQHYNHSSHLAPALHPLQPSVNDHASRLLIQNDIPPSSLLRSQFQLFENSDMDQQARLIMLWRLAPPTYARNGGQQLADRLGEYQIVSLAQEEELAWLRYQSFYSKGNVKTDVLAEQLCGRTSVLSEYYGENSGGAVQGGTHNEYANSRNQFQDGSGWWLQHSKEKVRHNHRGLPDLAEPYMASLKSLAIDEEREDVGML